MATSRRSPVSLDVGGITVTFVTAAVGVSLYIACFMLKSKHKLEKNIPSAVYDRAIVPMTSVWYRRVLNKLKKGSNVLDVGIGTAGALLTCRDVIEDKDLHIVGIDYNYYYIVSAQKQVAKCAMKNRISVVCKNVYDVHGYEHLLKVLRKQCGKDRISRSKRPVFDAVYLSGSFSLLPDPVMALQTIAMSNVLAPDARIYVTQTYQRRSPSLLHIIKPLTKYFTSIDFGNLITEKEVLRIFEESDLIVEEHVLIPDSVDNYWQGAYMTVLRVK